MKEKIINAIQGLKNKIKCDKVTYRIFDCPMCSQKLRVPKGKGKIEITCRRCGHVFIRRS
ncbi:MAG: hypothetical protein K6G24_03500 [Lachnospiraceae bacterium]|nr:hypothetical protein [Lachnospiraceae bacterium]